MPSLRHILTHEAIVGIVVVFVLLFFATLETAWGAQQHLGHPATSNFWLPVAISFTAGLMVRGCLEYYVYSQPDYIEARRAREDADLTKKDSKL